MVPGRQFSRYLQLQRRPHWDPSRARGDLLLKALNVIALNQKAL